ncbi:MAG: response regulator transcription factor [Nocardioidaceae bacterium]
MPTHEPARTGGTAGPDVDLRVLLVDDHVTFTQLLSIGIRHEEGLTCVGTAADIETGVRLVDELRPDVVVMDVELGEEDGLDATARLTRRHPGLRVVVLTARTDSALMQRASDAGACCLLPKNGSLLEVLRALRTARPGEMAVHPALLKQLLSRPGGDTPRVQLTQREQDILAGLSRGHDVRRIAEQLNISPHTCRGHVRSLLSKLDAHSQLEAVAIAHRQGLLTAGR